MNETTRREFIEMVSKATAGTMFLSIAGCQDATVIDDSSNRIGFITDVDDGSWFYFSAFGIPATAVPRISADDWNLEVLTGGKKVADVSFRLLKAIEARGEDVTFLKTMRCILGPYVQDEAGLLTATGLFRGVPLATVLEETAISPEVLKLKLFGADNFATAVAMSRVLDESLIPIILAYELNGAPIPPKYGGPVRLVAPEMWAFKCVKWITQIDATTEFTTFGTFEEGMFGGRAFIDNPGNIGLMTTLRNPSQIRAEVSSPFTMSGMSLVGLGRITSVEYSVDDGAWQQAEIIPLEEVIADIGHLGLLVREAEQFGQSWPYPDVWVPWRVELELPAGNHNVAIRSSDDDSRTNLPSAVEQHQIAPSLSLQLTVT